MSRIRILLQNCLEFLSNSSGASASSPANHTHTHAHTHTHSHFLQSSSRITHSLAKKSASSNTNSCQADATRTLPPQHYGFVTGLRLLSYRKITLRTMCLQIIWWENKKFQQRSWSATIPCREDMVQVGCD